MRSKLVSALVAGALIVSSSVAVAQTVPEPVQETALGSEGESALRGGSGVSGLAIFLGLVVIVLAIFIGRGGDDRPISP